MIGYVNRRSCYYHITVLGEMMDYVNRRSCCCHIAVFGGILKSGKRAQLTKCRIKKGILVSWLIEKGNVR